MLFRLFSVDQFTTGALLDEFGNRHARFSRRAARSMATSGPLLPRNGRYGGGTTDPAKGVSAHRQAAASACWVCCARVVWPAASCAW